MGVPPAEVAAIPLFASLENRELREIAGWFETKSVSAGVNLAVEGATGYSFLVIADGTAIVTSNGIQLATLGPGDFFGEIAMLGSGRRSATVTTTSPARLLVMFGTAFRQLEQSYPQIADRLMEAMAARLAGASVHETGVRPSAHD